MGTFLSRILYTQPAEIVDEEMGIVSTPEYIVKDTCETELESLIHFITNDKTESENGSIEEHNDYKNINYEFIFDDKKRHKLNIKFEKDGQQVEYNAFTNLLVTSNSLLKKNKKSVHNLTWRYVTENDVVTMPEFEKLYLEKHKKNPGFSEWGLFIDLDTESQKCISQKNLLEHFDIEW